ncbi:hypothetical protein CEP52_005323 [Fusarium oligoseptatum]|uniref:Peptidase A1 domain-containing protein n=1 Tax=Fusarium oligoseptatum TaxID=2604345 RepID=A0A428TZ29_9HYPO|nr:hypothetical protein CEP52_005323 [Fusarium oligoseptatum]
MLFNSLTALLGSAAVVSALPAFNKTIQAHNGTVNPGQGHGHGEGPDVEVVVVYGPSTKCPDKCSKTLGEPHSHDSPPSSHHSHSEGYGSHQDGYSGSTTFEHEELISTLIPAVHWDCNTKPAANLIPIPAHGKSEMYYGVDKPDQGGQYAFLTYYFDTPSVNLDHCGHISSIEYGNDGLSITFTSKEAFNHAYESWKDDEDLILITYTEGCGDWGQGERCYFKVTGLVYKKGELCIIAIGVPSHPDDITAGGDTEWGYWEPRNPGGHHPGYSGSPPAYAGGAAPTGGAGSGSGSGAGSGGQGGGSFTWNPTGTASSPPSATSANGDADSGSTDFSAIRNACKPPVDTRFGLPTACLGEFFDLDLDNNLGYDPVSQQYLTFARDLAPGLQVEEEQETLRRVKRAFGLGFIKNKVKKFIKNPIKFLKEAISISGSFNREFSWQLPDRKNKNSKGNKLKDPSTKQVKSPWGDSVLLKAFGSQKPGKDGKLAGYMNVFCVGCGVSGSARVGGKASWGIGGFTKGEVTINTDIRFLLQIGVDAQMTYTKEWYNNLLEIGLPGLSYGIVRIGPAISVDSRVKLEAQANGKLLAGAEMGLQNAQAKIDFVNPSQSSKQNWDPYFKPIFEAEGDLMLSASLGLPLGIKCGIKVSKWSRDVALIDEPSIKGVAQAAASIGPGKGNKFSAGFSEINGCTGISTQITWRNQLYIDLLGLKRFSIHDTKDRPIKRGCISLPGRPVAGTSAGSTKATTGTSKPTGTTKPTGTAKLTGTAKPTKPTNTKPTKLGNAIAGAKPTGKRTGKPMGIAEPVAKVDPAGAGGPVATADPSIPGDSVEPGPNSPAMPGSDDQGGDGQASASEQIGESEDTPARRIRARQADSNAASSTGSPEPDTDDSETDSSDVGFDLTSRVENGTSDLSYDLKSFGNKPYNLTGGFEVALIVDTDARNMLVSCANGNAYVFSAEGEDNPNCSEMWASKEDVVVFDGADRLMHYYNNSMAATGVSRLRLEDETDIPSGGVVVAFAPYFPNPDSDEYFFFENDAGSKLFLAEDPDEGAKMLKSPDLTFTVTGGKVTDCYAMPLMMGEYKAGDDWETPSETSDADWEWEFEDE